MQQANMRAIDFNLYESVIDTTMRSNTLVCNIQYFFYWKGSPVVQNARQAECVLQGHINSKVHTYTLYYTLSQTSVTC